MSTDWSEEVDSILEQLLSLHEELREGLEGCSAEHLEDIESTLGVRLPATLAELLRRIGRSRGHLFAGADFSYPEILGYREVAASLLAEQEELDLEEHTLVFWMEQGYQFFFVNTGESEDPTVFFYNDDDPEFVEVAESFTEWLRGCIGEEVELRGSSPGG